MNFFQVYKFSFLFQFLFFFLFINSFTSSALANNFTLSTLTNRCKIIFSKILTTKTKTKTKQRGQADPFVGIELEANMPSTVPWQDTVDFSINHLYNFYSSERIYRRKFTLI